MPVLERGAREELSATQSDDEARIEKFLLCMDDSVYGSINNVTDAMQHVLTAAILHVTAVLHVTY